MRPRFFCPRGTRAAFPTISRRAAPVINMAYARIEEARAKGHFGMTPATEIGLAMTAMGQGFVSMYQAGRFVGEKQFRAAYRAALTHCLKSFAPEAMS